MNYSPHHVPVLHRYRVLLYQVFAENVEVQAVFVPGTVRLRLVTCPGAGGTRSGNINNEILHIILYI